MLTRTADMVALAEAGRLDEVVGRAREASPRCARPAPTRSGTRATPALRPQPTLQALDLLGATPGHRRDVEIRLTARIPRRLPTAVDLAAYHACETVLAVGGEEPMVVELDADDSALTLTAIAFRTPCVPPCAAAVGAAAVPAERSPPARRVRSASCCR
ncbi:hypothetical protein GCM10023238_17140 [Streptomyces heliomycini]